MTRREMTGARALDLLPAQWHEIEVMAIRACLRAHAEAWDEAEEDGLPFEDALPFDETLAPRAPVGRNDPCPCGSGKKYKKCCGR